MPTSPEPLARLLAGLAQPDAYSHATRGVHVVQTASSAVFLTGDYAYKIKKPVRMAFLDFSTLERRRAVCHEEVRVNAPLAASLDMRVRAIVVHGGAYAFADADAPDAVEYAIEMRRFDEARTMAALIRRGELTDSDVRAIARRLADDYVELESAAFRDKTEAEIRRDALAYGAALRDLETDPLLPTRAAGPRGVGGGPQEPPAP